MTKPLFLLDVDGVIADFQSAVQRCIVEVCPDEKLDLSVWDFTKTLSSTARAHYVKRSATRDFCAGIAPYRGAKTAIRKLRSLCDVVAVTSPLKHSPEWTHAREDWLMLHFGIDEVVHTKHKQYVVGDFLLDDKVENVDSWYKMWRGAHNDGHQRGLIWAQPYNASAAGDDGEHAYITSWQHLLDHVADVIRSHAVPIRGRDFH